MKITSLFSNNMVIQRDEEQYIWGTTTPDTAVTGSFGECTFSTRSNADGAFRIALPQLKAGGPYTLTLTADETVQYTDVLVGDVFLCGGQSNMEYTMGMLKDRLGDKEIHEDEEYIRSFSVPKVFNFDHPVDELYDSRWVKAHGQDLRSFSAAGFYAAKRLYAKHKVPVGLIHAAVGGTPAKSWCSEQTVRRMGLYAKELDLCQTPGYVQSTEQKDNDAETRYIENAMTTFSAEDSIASGTVSVPSLWREKPLADVNGTVKVTRTFTLTKEQAAMSLDVCLGTIRDYDVTYINGVRVGSSVDRYTIRRYAISQGILKEGENVIEIDIIVFRERGGFDDEKELFLCPSGTMKKIVDLSGTWEYHIKKLYPTLSYRTFFLFYPVGLYQGMLYPLRDYRIRAAMYYQGESNVLCREYYKAEMDALIADWRALFKSPELPFIQVQLAGWCDSDKANIGSGWAELRQQQLLAAKAGHNYLVQAYDLGEYNDLHPWNKEELGYRIADVLHAILSKDWNAAERALNPEAERVLLEDGKLRVTFRNTGRGLRDCVDVHNVTVTDADGNTKTAKATLSGNILTVDAPCAKEIAYAWSDFAENINLYGANGLPVIPFKIVLEETT